MYHGTAPKELCHRNLNTSNNRRPFSENHQSSTAFNWHITLKRYQEVFYYSARSGATTSITCIAYILNCQWKSLASANCEINLDRYRLLNDAPCVTSLIPLSVVSHHGVITMRGQ